MCSACDLSQRVCSPAQRSVLSARPSPSWCASASASAQLSPSRETRASRAAVEPRLGWTTAPPLACGPSRGVPARSPRTPSLQWGLNTLKKLLIFCRSKTSTANFISRRTLIGTRPHCLNLWRRRALGRLINHVTGSELRVNSNKSALSFFARPYPAQRTCNTAKQEVRRTTCGRDLNSPCTLARSTYPCGAKS